ncbi:MAG TPA: hypothetical protein VLQ45_14175 [Thermoanaerobaculia bacterium]|nr:hypothetical protein [Thermoanaerobaculia bacterium]
MPEKRNLSTAMPIPPPPYVGLYGSHSGDWRDEVAGIFEAEGVAFYDPTDPRWKGIDEKNGDEKQELIDLLVAEQHKALNGAACVVFHLARWETRNGVTDKAREKPALAARCEIGFLAGRGIRTFVHVEPDVEGRNYLWAQIALYPHTEKCDSLESAVHSAIAFVKEAKAAGG